MSGTLVSGTIFCNHRNYAGTLETPPEYCEEEAMQDEDFCPEHIYEGDWDNDDDRDAYDYD